MIKTTVIEKTKLPNEIEIISDEEYVDKKVLSNHDNNQEWIKDDIAPSSELRPC